MINADLILIICLALGLIGGLIRGWWRCLVGMLVLFGACLILYFGVFDYAAKWVEYDSLEFLSQQFGFNLTYEIQDLGVTVRLTNIKDTFLLLQNTGLDPVLLNATSEGFAKTSVALVGFLVLLVAGFVLSTILYWIILKWIMPKRLRKGFVARLFGGIFGMIEMGTICVIFFQFSGNLAIPLDSVILPQLQDTNSDLYKLIIDSGVVTSSDLNTYVGYVQTVLGVLNPLSENCQFINTLFNYLGNIGLSPFNIISVDVIDETGAKVPIAFKDAFTDMLDNFIDVSVGKLNTLLGA